MYLSLTGRRRRCRRRYIEQIECFCAGELLYPHISLLEKSNEAHIGLKL